MKLENRFTVPANADTAWNVLRDAERIVPCLPGATLTEVAGDECTGEVTVRLGPVHRTYGGTVRVVSRDDEARVAVIEGIPRGSRGTGKARVTVTCRLHERAPGSTDVEVDTDLAPTGRPAQLGRAVLADVTARLVDRFAACLEEEIREDAAGGTGGGGADRGGADAERMEAAVTAEPSDEPDSPAVRGETPPAGDGVGAGADGGAAAAAKVAADAEQRAAGPTTGPAGGAAAAASGSTEGLDAGPAGPGVPVHGQEASPEGARQATGTSPRPAGSRRQSAEAIDLLATAGGPVAKRAVPVLVGVVLLVVVLRRGFR